MFLLDPQALRNGATIVLIAFAASGCRSYNQRTADAFRDFEQGRFQEAMVAYAEDGITKSDFLAGAEAGMVAIAAGDWDAAVEYLTRAANAVSEIEEEALISPENAAESILSWAINETFKEYYGEGYERALLHATLALAYLGSNSLEGALVEVRRANRLLESEEKLYETEYAAGGLGHFVSALGYEIQGELADAYIDYKRMEKKGVGGELVGRALVRLAGALGRDDEIDRWVERWGPSEVLPPDAARIVVIAGVGHGAYKVEGRLDIPTRDGLLSWAVPDFAHHPQPIDSLELRVDGTSVRTVIIEDVGRIAAKNLDDRLAWLIAKSTVRAFIKREMTKELEEKHGLGGRIFGDIFTFVTERADLRAWKTLPDTWQACRLFVPAGPRNITLNARGGDSLRVGTFEVLPGETMFLVVRTLGQRMYVHPIGGSWVSGPAETPVGEAVGTE